jgi:hypothetical protein
MLKKVCCGKTYNLNQESCDVCGKRLIAKMFCDKCGAEIPNGKANCEKCGAPVKPKTENAKMESNKMNLPAFKEKIPKGKNTLIIVFCAVVALLLLAIILVPKPKNYIAGKWIMITENNNNASQLYIEFKSNGTFSKITLESVEKGKYKIIKGGNSGRVQLIPDVVNSPSYEMDYTIKGDILTLDNKQFKKVK